MDHRLTWRFPHRPATGRRVLYWMQASVRVRDNLALVLAQAEARDRGLPLDVLFCLDPGYPGANARSFAFLLDGLADAARGLGDLGLSLTVARGPAVPAVTAAGAWAALVVFDRGYLPFARRQRDQVAAVLPCPVVEAEDNASVPVSLVSDKDEWAAATLRPKLMCLAGQEAGLPRPRPGLVSGRPDLVAEDLSRAGIQVLAPPFDNSLLTDLGVDAKVPPVGLPGGETAAWARWEEFRDHRLADYDRARNDPNLDGQSGLGPALHFGHLSPAGLVEDLKSRGLWREPFSYRKAGEDPVSKFLDEVLVRRELSLNFVTYNPDHGTWLSLPAWARKTLTDHGTDRREALYDRAQWEAGQTHDPAWNAAQHQLATTGIIHGYMRMYWGKKLLEWSADPAQAYLDALYLNDKYALDGRDPNSYAGVAWCFGKHDRPWGERPVYGLVRSMTSGGLRRKFDLDAYVRRFSPPPLEFTLRS